MEEAIRQVGHDLLWHLVKNMLFRSVATLPLLQAYWNQAKRYEPLHGFKACFETTWIGRSWPPKNMRRAGPLQRRRRHL
jgi:hypothetical protein